jgi:hypothetical protein
MPIKVEYPPLLPAGFHSVTREALRQKCVIDFPLSKTRGDIMAGLDKMIEELENAGVTGELWIDGSFATEKIDPDDVDVLLCVDANSYDIGAQETRDAIDKVESHSLKASLHCDSYVWREYLPNHLAYNESQWDRAYWIRQFGFSRGDDYKGILVLAIRPKPEANA